MFARFFGSKKSDPLKNVLSSHEQNSSANLHQNHPHLRGLLDKHNIDLKQIRRRGVKVAAAAAILGAFLSIPFLIGHPRHQDQPTPKPEAAKSAPLPDRSVLVPEEGLQPHGVGPSVAQGSSKAKGSPESRSDVGVPPGDGKDKEEENPESKSQGHKYGRSYLAPPKAHGFHDLGLHKGEGSGKGTGRGHEGPHPEELDVRHQDKGDK